ncbi:MAG: type IV secretion system DNA-binding domain-containing protein [Desulfobacteraceae bacterium]|nr:type IV secretion system DNA-binding domain-containing protein [Desulfobacteraceae bacterium]
MILNVSNDRHPGELLAGAAVGAIVFITVCYGITRAAHLLTSKIEGWAVDWYTFKTYILERICWFAEIDWWRSDIYWPYAIQAYPDFTGMINIVCYSTVVLAASVAIWLGILMSRGSFREMYVSGRFVDANPAAARAELKKDPGKPGLWLHPKIQISSIRESFHILTVGASGTGKTTFIWPLIMQIFGRNEKMIIHDIKGDFSSCFDAPEFRVDQHDKGEPSFMRLAIWDRRGVYWDIGKDCRERNEARELAACMIRQPDNVSDPMWSNSAQAVLVTFLLQCQAEYGTKWGWKTLVDCIDCDDSQLQEIIAKYNPEAKRIIKEPSRTTDGIMITFTSWIASIYDLKRHWGDGEGMIRVSFKRFLADDYRGPKTLILQNNDNYGTLLKSLFPAILKLMTGHLNGPEFPNSETRRIWFILDEFIQLGKLEGIQKILEVGRSKGLRLLCGLQSFVQLSDVYNEFKMKNFTSLFATRVIFSIDEDTTKDAISKNAGKMVVRVFNKGDSRTEGKKTVQNSSKDVEREAIQGWQLASELGVEGKNFLMPWRGGCTGLIMFRGCKNGLYRMKWPFFNSKEQRPIVLPLKKRRRKKQNDEVLKSALTKAQKGDTEDGKDS